MQITTYAANQPVLLLIDGLVNFEHVITYLRADFHIIEVRVDGNHVDEDIVELEEYIKDQCAGHVDYAYGTDMGGHILMKLCARQQVHIDQAVFGSVNAKNHNRFISLCVISWMLLIYGCLVKKKRYPWWYRLFHRQSSRARRQYNERLALLMLGHFGDQYNDLKSLLKWHFTSSWPASFTTDTKLHFFWSMKMGARYPRRYIKQFAHLGLVMMNQYQEEMLVVYPMRWVQFLKNTFDPKSIPV